jgi:hypothetical protein
MDFLQKYFYRVFEPPLPRNAQKRTKKKVRKKSGWLVGSSKVNQIYVEVRHFFFECPSKDKGKDKGQGQGAAVCC